MIKTDEVFILVGPTNGIKRLMIYHIKGENQNTGRFVNSLQSPYIFNYFFLLDQQARQVVLPFIDNLKSISKIFLTDTGSLIQYL